jgi:hypothetical protein
MTTKNVRNIEKKRRNKKLDDKRFVYIDTA